MRAVWNRTRGMRAAQHTMCYTARPARWPGLTLVRHECLMGLSGSRLRGCVEQ